MAQVTIKQGKIRGTTSTSLTGETFHKFLGIPFAKPPLGELRFKAPQPAESWSGVRDCIEDGHVAFTSANVFDTTQGFEDCLYLNVFTRDLPESNDTLKPVMVYIHGGGFTIGNGTQQMCTPDFVMTQDVVYVTMNYRLSVLGFLSLEDVSLDVPGNAGLKDQTMALRWVQENIKQFNGDPNNVTIFGISAGGASVQFQMLSPTAKNLFHKAIAQSGSVLNSWAWGQRNAILLAEKLGKSVKNEKEALEVLLEASAEEVVKAANQLTDNIFDIDARRPFGPIIEKPNPTAFLTEDPSTLLASGNFNQVPLIQGACSNEGQMYALTKTLAPGTVDYEKNVIPWFLKSKSSMYPEWTTKLRNLYFNSGYTKDERIYHIISDVSFLIGIVQSTELMLRKSVQPIFVYVFDYISPMIKHAKEFLKIDSPGCFHGCDMMFFSTFQFIPSGAPLTEDDRIAILKVNKMWADFARDGTVHPSWEPVRGPERIEYLRIQQEPEMLSSPFEERMAVWREILQEAGNLDLKFSESAN
ncbi:hypothetical protein ABEB36_006552 [Hypothenemus hampei]|uniref:Carboxylesterase type B domain-containing protein n=1 Tax=Hypothenemus hampei TaxID=57062 RepID=A0ABD1EUT4_HYPHA